MDKRDIFEREVTGELISIDDPEHEKILAVIIRAQKITAKLNGSYHSEEEVRAILSELTGTEIDSSVWLMPPFYTDFGKNTRIGKNVFINHACTFMDRGGITIEDKVLIGPKVNLLTIDHPVDPQNRRSTVSKPILIRKNAWLGAGAMVMSGVTIGENAVISAGAVVTKDVPDNTVVAGIPARIIKTI